MGNPKKNNLEKPIQVTYKKTGARKRKYCIGVSSKKKCMHSCMTSERKNIGDIHMYHGDSSMLTERKREKMYTPYRHKKIHPILDNRI